MSEKQLIGSTHSDELSPGFVNQLEKQRQDFCILGLTGRVRSGTSQVCELLTDPMFAKRLPMPDNRNKIINEQEEKSNSVWDNKKKEDEESREYRIVYRFLRDRWKPFVEVSVTSVIISYCFEEALREEMIGALNNRHQKNKEQIEANKGAAFEHSVKGILSLINQKLCTPKEEKKPDSSKEEKTPVSSFVEKVQARIIATDRSLKHFSRVSIKEEREDIKQKIKEEEEKVKKHIEEYLNGAYTIEWFFDQWKDTKSVLDSFSPTDYSRSPQGEDPLNKNKVNNTYYFCYGVLPTLDSIIQDAYKDSDKGLDKNEYSFLFQDFGNSIRATGSLKYLCQTDNSSLDIDAKHLFDLPARINQFIKVLRSPHIKDACMTPESPRYPVFVIINNFKNVFETFYFKQRYSAFYLMAVSSDEDTRRDRFSDRDMYFEMNLREELSSGKKVFKRAQDLIGSKEKDYWSKEDVKKIRGRVSTPEMNFITACSGENNLRYYAYKNNFAPFILQDVVTCVENADVFVTRNYTETEAIHDHPLRRQLARTVTLLLHPGLLVPTKVERCMQIAMTAKLNSGCLSRQVGAVVTDKDYNILSLGWNDAPCGTEVCLRRNLYDLIGKEDSYAFSDYELKDPDFRAYLDVIKEEFNHKKGGLNGLPMAFCFKDIYQDLIRQRDQIYTRALHGEERAIASCKSDEIKGGYLFTTSSPCELCAKRAKEAGISKIYYIQLYPGISKDHVIQIGYPPTRAKYEFFVGATGLAYIKLYTPLIPYKDELAALGYSPSETYRKLTAKKQNKD